MNRQIAFILLSSAAGAFAGYFHKNLSLITVADKSPVILSIFMAALFVRLARGVPPFPFEKIHPEKSEVILAALGHLRNMYSHAFVSFVFAIIVSVSFSASMPLITLSWARGILTGILVASLSWALTTAYLIFQTDISLFRSQSDAMGEVVSGIAAQSAAKAAETVRNSLIRKNE